MDFTTLELTAIVLIIALLALSARLWQLHITKNKLLMTSEERFLAVYENSLPLLIIDKNGNVISANNHAKRLFGYDESQLIGMSVEALMPARFREHHVALRNDYMRHPIIRPMGKERDLYILTSAGKEVPVEISLTPTTLKSDFCGYDTNILRSCAFDSCVLDACVLCTIYDLSYQKKSEEVLRKSEARYRNLYDLMNEGYCIIEIIFDASEKPIDFLYLQINSAFEKQTGLKVAQGKRASELMPTLEKKWFDVLGQVALTGKPIDLEDYVSDLHGWFKAYAFRFEPAKNKQVAIIFSNITQQKEHEKRLFEYGRNAQLLYKTIQIANETNDIKEAMKNCLDFICDSLNLPIGHIYFLDVKKSPVFESSHIWYLRNPEKFREFKEASETIKLSESQGLPGRIWKTGKPAWILDVFQDDNFPRATYCRSIGIHSAFGFPLLSDEKFTVVFEFFSYELQEYNEELSFTFEVMSKQMSRIFENKKMYRELEKYVAKLKLLNQKLDDFTYIASHDLKEPLRGINNFSNFLLEDYADKLDDEGKEKLNTLVKLSQRMYKLIDQLLKYSKIGHGDFSIQYCDIGKIIDEKLELMGAYIREKNAEIKILKKMPTILCDTVYIGEVFQNLISNGIKYNDNDLKKIEISYEEDNKSIIFSVKDNGIGIPEESYDTVFKIFKRLHAKEEYGGGEGLGMAILKQIVEKHNGKVWIDSVVGVGTTIYFSISKELDNKEFF